MVLSTVSKCVSCCYLGNRNHNNNNNKNNDNKNNGKNLPNISSRTFAICSILTLASIVIGTVQGAAVYSNVNFLANPNFEPICNAQQEHFIESDGKESSLILEFNPGVLAEKKKSCTRILSAPSNYGFIVRLILPKIRHNRHATTTAAELNANGKIKLPTASTLNEMTTLIEKLNATALKTVLGRTCPLSIFSSLDPHTPQWRVDPCQLEDTAPEMEDPVRLFHGRVRIVWEHGHNTLHSKLMVTALGKGDQCRSENKHQCLRIGDEPILCISQELVCDGIRHCPYSNEYDSDEDYEMCWKRRRFGEPMPPAMESDIFEHFALEVFRNLFAFDVPTGPDESKDTNSNSTTTLRKVDSALASVAPPFNSSNAANATVNATATENTTESTSFGHHRRNSTRLGLNSDLSKYGPWGYLMLGMLLCGGALLICGLWASASQHAANNERESALQNANSEHQSSSAAPPNYEELDPPPAYSVLFPNQKANSSSTLSSLGVPAVVPHTAAAAAAANVSTGTTRAQVETASGSQQTQQQQQQQQQAQAHV